MEDTFVDPAGDIPRPLAESRWPKYRCHKVVAAMRCKSKTLVNDEGLGALVQFDPFDPTLPPFVEKADGPFGSRAKLDDPDPGVLVLYADGYVSWSPTKAFDEGYTLIKE